MSDADMLASLFLQRHLPEAANVLEECEPESIAAFAASLPEDSAVDLLSALSTSTAADCLEHIDDDDAVAKLSAMPRRKSAAVLRLVAPARRNILLQKMSAPTRIQLEVILLQPMHRVGAWMESHPLALPRESTLEFARKRLQRQPSTLGEVYVVDGAGRLLGIVALPRLLAEPDDATIETVVIPAAGVLRANESVENALNHAAWRDVDLLPVIDQEEKLVGSIRHAALRLAATRPRDSGNDDTGGDYVLLANNLYVGLAEVLATSISKTPDETPLRPEEGGRR